MFNYLQTIFPVSVVNNASVSASRLNNGPMKIQNSAFHWKTFFNPGLTKQAKEVIFSIPGTSPSLSFNNSLIQEAKTPYTM